MSEETKAAAAMPEGFAPPPPKEQKQARDYDSLGGEGTVAFFNKTRYVHDKTGKEYTIHSFVTLDADDTFELFGCAALDAQLSTVSRSAKVFLRYDGKVQQGMKSLHRWTVGVADSKQ
jgi:hypothetical protein